MTTRFSINVSWSERLAADDPNGPVTREYATGRRLVPTPGKDAALDYALNEYSRVLIDTGAQNVVSLAVTIFGQRPHSRTWFEYGEIRRPNDGGPPVTRWTGAPKGRLKVREEQ